MQLQAVAASLHSPAPAIIVVDGDLAHAGGGRLGRRVRHREWLQLQHQRAALPCPVVVLRLKRVFQ